MQLQNERNYRYPVLAGICRNAFKIKEGPPLDSLSMEIINIGDLPIYNEDAEASEPATWKAFREQIKSFDGLLFVTPEYNRSVPAVLKNAIDVGSRPTEKVFGMANQLRW